MFAASAPRSSCFCSFSQDIGDLQRFTGIALMAHCEHGPSVDKLTALEKVCTKLAPFIYQLPTDTDVYGFISVCKQIRLDNMHEMIAQLVRIYYVSCATGGIQ